VKVTGVLGENGGVGKDYLIIIRMGEIRLEDGSIAASTRPPATKTDS